MAQLAIKGHPTRGNEVIEILKMLGGKTSDRELYGNVPHYGYYIYDDGHISLNHCSLLKNAIVFTLEEFLEKFPYKVGDKVSYKQNKKTYFIRKMFWEKDKILYELSDEVYSEGSSTPDTIIFDVDVIKLQPYKEETMDGKYNVEKYLKVWEETEKGLEVVVNDNFELKEDSGKFYIVEKQPQYPKTYEECCEVLGIDVSKTIGHSADCPFYKDVTCYENNLLSSLAYLRKLLICRDAYWKIAGEQMGLGKPWEPDWDNLSTNHEFIKISKGCFTYSSRVLVFPTAEMRDAFYENFKELIKECISLL